MAAEVSAIIPTLNAAKTIGQLILSLRDQTLPCREIIVVDSSSADDTAKIARELGAIVKVIPRSRFDHGGTRNLGASLASGDVFLYLTQDALPAGREFVANITRPLSGDNGVAACCGRQLPRQTASDLERFAREFNYDHVARIKSREDIPVLGIKTFFYSNACSAIRRSVFEEIGRFPENVVVNEDMVLAARLITKGYRIAYEPSATVYHSHEFTLGQVFRRYFDIGVVLSRQRWILDQARPETEGWRYVRESVGFLKKRGRLLLLPHFFAEALVKYAAYRLGLLESFLPVALKKKLSTQKAFWTRETKG